MDLVRIASEREIITLETNLNVPVLFKVNQLLMICSLFLLSACIDLDDKGDSSNIEEIKVLEGVTVSSGVKSYTFSWPAYPESSYYQLLEKNSELDEFEVISENIDPANLSFTLSDVALHTKFESQYIVRACNNSECVDSAPIAMRDYLWNSVGYLKPSQAGDRQLFGRNTAISKDGKVLAVHANDTGPDSMDREKQAWGPLYGAVFLYKKVGNEWVYDTLIQSPNKNKGDNFGEGLSLNHDGSVLAAGAPWEDGEDIDTWEHYDSSYNHGAVYLYRKVNEVWELQSRLNAPVNKKRITHDEDLLFGYNMSDELFGKDVLLADNGERLIATTGTENDEPAVYVFDFISDENNWILSKTISLSKFGGPDQSYFDVSISLSSDGNVLVIGAGWENTNGFSSDGYNLGTVLVYENVKGNWALKTELSQETTGVEMDGRYQRFGSDVSISAEGDYIAVSAPLANTVYFFSRENGSDFIYDSMLKQNSMNPLYFRSIQNYSWMSADANTLIVSSFIINSKSKSRFYMPREQIDLTNESLAQGIAVYQKQRDLWIERTFIRVKSGTNPSISLDAAGGTILIGIESEKNLNTGLSTVENIDIDNTAYFGGVGSVLMF